MFYQAFSNIAKRFPQKTAVIVNGHATSYAELEHAVLGFSSTLLATGVNPGDAALILLPNSLEFIVATFATMAIGAIAVPVNTKFPPDEIKYYIDSSEAVAVIRSGVPDIGNAVAQAYVEIPISFPALLECAHGDLDIHLNDRTIDGAMPAIYMYSSGSTGKPKRITRTHGQLISEAQSLATTIKPCANERILCTIPLYHAHGFGNCLMAALLNGGTLILTQGEFNPRDTVRLLEQHKITIYPAVPFMFKMMGETFFKLKPQLTDLRLLFSAGAALPVDVIEHFEQIFGLRIRQLYGSTETGAVAINYNGPRGTESSVGYPLHGFEIDILDESGIPVDNGEIGEIAIFAPSMTTKYDGLPDITAECFVGDYFLPGDLGSKDADGRIYIKGRKKLLINVAGYKVDPLDVEAVISTHPKVVDVVVLGQADPNYGEMVKAVVVPNSDCSAEEIISYCAQRLIGYKIPKLVTFRSEIPRSPLGKILRKYLQDD